METSDQRSFTIIADEPKDNSIKNWQQVEQHQ